MGDALGSAFAWAKPAVESVVEQVSPAAAAAAEKATEAVVPRSKGVLTALRARLRRVKPPPKPVLLLVCLSALKFGLVRTLLIALTAKLAVELSIDAVQGLRAWRATPRGRGGSGSGSGGAGGGGEADGGRAAAAPS